MKRISIISFFILALASLGFGYWGHILGIYGPPYNKWLMPIAVVFFIPSMIFAHQWYMSTTLNDLIGGDFPGRREEHFKELVGKLCRRWNGRSTNNLIFWRLTSEEHYDLRQELLKRDNYRGLIGKLIDINRFYYSNGSGEHSHRDYTEHIRGIIFETEVEHFKKLLVNKPDISKDRNAFLAWTEHLIRIELLSSFSIVGFGFSHQLVDIVAPIFDDLSDLAREEFLQDTERRTAYENMSKAVRDEAIRGFPAVLLNIRKEVARRKERATAA